MRARLICAWVLAVLASAACHTMRPVTLDELRGMAPHQVVVTRADQSVAVVSHPQVLGDTLVGFVERKYQVMPPGDVKQVEVERPATGRTAALLGVGALGVVGIAAALLSTGGSSSKETNSKCDIGESGQENVCPQ